MSASRRECVRLEGLGEACGEVTLVRPVDGGGLRPGVLLARAPEGSGEGLIERLAAAGYCVLAHAPQLAALPDREALEGLEVGLAALAARSEVDPDRLAVVGFGRGGTLAYLLACRSVRVAAAVSFSGPLVYEALSAERPVQPLELALNLSAPLLAHFGEQDDCVPAEHVALLEEVLSRSFKHFDIVVRPGTGLGAADGPGQGHLPQPAADAWARTLAFLHESLELDRG